MTHRQSGFFVSLILSISLPLWVILIPTSFSSTGRSPVNLEPLATRPKTLSILNTRLHPYLAHLATHLNAPGTDLRQLQHQARGAGFRWIEQRLHVRVVLDPQRSDSFVRELGKLGLRIHTHSLQEVEILVPPNLIADIAHLPGVRWVAPPRWLEPKFTSQGLRVIGAESWRLLPQLAGNQETRIGIVDIGYKYYQDLFGDELPASNLVTVKNFRSDNDFETTEHGTAVAEIVTDFDRNIHLFLAAISTTGELAQAIDWLIGNNVIAISGSIGTSFRAGNGTGSPEYDGIRRAAQKGIVPIFAAGNEALEHWIAPDFRDDDGDGILNYTSQDELNCFEAQAGDEISVLLEWFDWPTSNRDYDLIIVSLPQLTEGARSDAPQTGSQEPIEFVDFIAPHSGQFCAIIQRFSGPTGVPIELFIDSPRCGGFTPCFDYTIPQSSIGAPADAREAIAVGAIIVQSDSLAPYSSRGPTLDGRLKPDISAPTHVDTWAYGHQGFLFTGTSAATPHVTGAVALIHQKLLGNSSGQTIYATLIPRTRDRGPVGPDNAFGLGLLYMLAR